MNNSDNFNRIALAIQFISDNFREQPDLDQVAREVNLSPFYFQRLFTDWAGVSPKKFLQYISLEYAKKILREDRNSLFDAALETGLSGSGRLHDLFIGIEGMTPGEYKNGGENLVINFSFNESPFGIVIVASTPKGICHLSFADDEESAFQALQSGFPKAQFIRKRDHLQDNALILFKSDWKNAGLVKLHLKGSPFQIKVWEALLKIPSGKLTTYSHIAEKINHPRAFRAVGSAVGDNPVAFLIPCHRVIRMSGALGEYHWGCARKAAMIGWEASRQNQATFF